MGKMWHIVASLFIFYSISIASVPDKCDGFLEKPVEGSYIVCENSILAPLKQGEEFSIIADNEKFKIFLSLLEKRNEYAVRLGFVLFRVSDGAKAEDLAISIGKLVNYNPELLLSLFVEEKYSDEDIKFVLLILGDKYVDNFSMQRKEVINRINILKNIKNEKLSDIKAKCIRFLSEEEKELSPNIIEEEKNKKGEQNGLKKKKLFWFF